MTMGKTIGNWWFNGGLMVVYWWFNGFTLWFHQSHGWLENHRSEWSFLAGNITELSAGHIFQHVMFHYILEGKMKIQK